MLLNWDMLQEEDFEEITDDENSGFSFPENAAVLHDVVTSRSDGKFLVRMIIVQLKTGLHGI